jgi:hypothetical protein
VIGWLADGRLSWGRGRPLLDGIPLVNPVAENLDDPPDD